MNRRLLIEFLPALFLLALPGCFDEDDCSPPEEPARTPGRVSIQQGIWGNVWFWSGDFMPTVPPCAKGTITAASRDIYVHDLTPMDSVTWAPRFGFFSEVKTKLVAVAHSDSTGFFEVFLPAGQYSLFIQEDSLLYANGFDGDGNIWPIAVKPDSVSEARLNITYDSSY